MSAPKRTQANTPYPSKAQASFRGKVLRYPSASVAFEKLAASGFDEGSLWRWLWVLSHAKRDFESARKRAPRHWYALPGFPPRTLRRFPDRVRGLAQQIEHINEAIQSDGVYRAAREWLPEIAKATDAGSPDAIRAELQRADELPKLLRSYADSISIVDRLVAHYAPKAPGRIHAIQPKLTEAARKLTRKPNYEEVSTLLTAAYEAVGSDEIVDAKALGMQHKRRKK
jgi:hypothetical protein